MAFLRFLGWFFVPYIMIWFRWKQIGTGKRVVGTIWTVIVLLGLIGATGPKSDQQTTKQAEKPAAQTAVKSESQTVVTPASTTPATTAQTAPAPAPEPEKPAMPKIGDKVVVGKLGALVHGVKSAKQVGNDFLNVKAQGTFLLIDTEIANLDKEARMIDTSMFKLIDADGVEYDPDPNASIYANSDNKFFLNNINPKLATRGSVVFDMPPDTKGLKLQVSSGVGFAAGESILIDLTPPEKKKK